MILQNLNLFMVMSQFITNSQFSLHSYLPPTTVCATLCCSARSENLPLNDFWIILNWYTL
jgi:hypothetical protein